MTKGALCGARCRFNLTSVLSDVNMCACRALSEFAAAPALHESFDVSTVGGAIGSGAFLPHHGIAVRVDLHLLRSSFSFTPDIAVLGHAEPPCSESAAREYLK